MAIYKKRGSSFKAKVALEALKEKKAINDLCQENGVSSSQISTWKKYVEENCAALFEKKNQRGQQEEIDKLHRIIGELTAERDFLERVLKR